jgi:hypothetical protein
MKVIKIIEANYLGHYVLQLRFNDDRELKLDFLDLIKTSRFPNEKKYLDTEQFKNFKIELGDLIWNDYDMCFPAKNLYKGQIRNHNLVVS